MAKGGISSPLELARKLEVGWHFINHNLLSGLRALVHHPQEQGRGSPCRWIRVTATLFALSPEGSQYFPRASAQAGEMLQCLPSEGEEETDSEERRDSSIEDSKEIVTLAFVRENTGEQKGLQNASQQGKKKRKKKRLGLKDGEWGAVLVRAGGT